MPDPNTLQLTDFEKAQAAILDNAAAHGELVVISTRRKDTGEAVALVAQVTFTPGHPEPYLIAPIAVLLPEDGIEQFDAPNMEDAA